MPMPLTLVGPSWSADRATDGRRTEDGTDRSHPPSAGRFRTERIRWSEARQRETAGDAGGKVASSDQ